MAIVATAANTHISADFSHLLEPGLRTIFFDTFNELPSQFDKIFKVKDSQRSFEQELGMGNFDSWVERVNDTDNVTYQKIAEGLLRTFTHKEFASGFAVGKRLYEDELYNIINKMPEDLAHAGRVKVETDAASVLNNAFAASGVTIYDGEALCSDAHPVEGGGSDTVDNLVTGALTATTLKTAITTMRKTTDNAGKMVVLNPDTLVVPPALEFTALEITKSAYKPGTDYNDINSLAGRLKVVVYDYLTSDTAWFLIDSKRHGLTFFWRVKPEFSRSTDSDNYVAKYAGRMRYSYGVSDFRGIVGSTGL